ncbi:kelch repeat protein [Opisthorchis viverrini]|uniref:Kelch repeat protein n=2 Tax=Opisthorchis viverrini TaxID=6198 RepID=A0A1S8WFY3_OPIVI|nr:hypothetical protein T265_01029 [Opisthorchis viverrini]KER32936.1 hypothetical protein T265_01029 [Opisthorchis viverrini]OON13355.1 kelch repeat protein [Opisthorchis viverrini]
MGQSQRSIHLAFVFFFMSNTLMPILAARHFCLHTFSGMEGQNAAPRTAQTTSEKTRHVLLVVGGIYNETHIQCIDMSSVAGDPTEFHSNEANENLRIPDLPGGRYDCVALELSGLIYVIGGVMEEGVITDSVAILDVASSRWTSGPCMRSPRARFGAVALDDKIYAIGGQDQPHGKLATTEVFEPLSQLWRLVAPMSRPRRDLAVAATQEEVYTVGGWDEGMLSIVECYQPRTDSWTIIASIATPLSEAGACVLGNRLYVAGGRTETGVVTDSAAFYNVNTNSWQSIAPMSQRRWRFGLVAHGGSLYAVGGNNRLTEELTSIERYDPCRNQWTFAPEQLKMPRTGAAVVLLHLTCSD